MVNSHEHPIISAFALVSFALCLILIAAAVGTSMRIKVLEEIKKKGRSEMTAFFTCNNCGRTIKDIRIQIVEDDQGEPEFLYYFVGDDEGEEVDKHYCAKCLAFLLVGHGAQEEPEVDENPEDDSPEKEEAGK